MTTKRSTTPRPAAIGAGASAGQTPRDLAAICRACQACCRDTVAPISDADLKRVARGTGLPPRAIARFFSPSEIDLGADDPQWVRLRGRRRVLGLRKGPDGDRCRFLADDGGCTIYPHRPATCRTFPFDVEIGKDWRLEKIEINGSVPCGYLPSDGRATRALPGDVRRELTEARAYERKLRRFERRQRLGGARELLRFLGLER